MNESASENQTITVAIIGNPNTGKSTLFNSLAGVHSRIGNYPGVTVEKKSAHVNWDGQSVELIDLPGTYSLAPRSIDEMVSVDVLLGRQKGLPEPDVIVCIADASNLERNLYLFSQVMDLSIPTILVLNMIDVAESRGITIDVKKLSESLKLPVVTTEAHRKRGLEDVQKSVLELTTGSSRGKLNLFPKEFYQEQQKLLEHLNSSSNSSQTDAKTPEYLADRLLLDVGGYVESLFESHSSNGLGEYLTVARKRLSEAGFPVPVSEARVRYAWAREVLTDSITQPTKRLVTKSDKIDRWLTHRFLGLFFFVFLMFIVFQAVYTWAGPFMGIIEQGQEFVSGIVSGVVPPGPFRSLIVDGVIAGVGGVIIFLPQIIFLFLFIALMEDCGYMARAAFLMDKLMTKLGLSGKSFVPLMSSFACAIPGVMATRTIENRRDRFTTILVAPLMSCSARLPVYILLIGAFIPQTSYFKGLVTLPGITLFLMSSIGALIAIPTAWILKKVFFKGETPPFVMELPGYKWPSVRIVFSRVFDRAKAFLFRAGTLIFATSIIVWAAGYFPGDHTEAHRLVAVSEVLDAEIEEMESRIGPLDEEKIKAGDLTDGEKDLVGKTSELENVKGKLNQLNGQLLENSFLGRAGHLIEPVVKPLGWDWRIGVGAIASFPAREVIISTLGTIYSLGGDTDEEDSGLIGAITSSKWPDGTKVFNIPVALSVMVFFALCAQCAATIMVIKRETNSWFWPIFSFTYMTTLAYIASFVTYQVGMMFV